MTWDTERMCRLNGQKPTARERWTAFYRLWRMAHGNYNDAHADIEASDCFRVLFTDWSGLRLIEGYVEDLKRSHWPLFIRRRHLEIQRRKRLYGDHYEWMERDKVTARAVRDLHGIEVTPDEVAVVRRKVINLARSTAAEKDIHLPEDDDDLLALLKEGSDGSAES